eukprot:354545-Chlamydomonas_euryale.AAC.3
MLMVVWMKGIPCCHALHRGVLNIVHGTHDVVNYMLDHPDIKAISFVGSDQAGRYIYSRGCANGKRVQSNMGAKVSHASFCCCQARIFTSYQITLNVPKFGCVPRSQCGQPPWLPGRITWS